MKYVLTFCWLICNSMAFSQSGKSTSSISTIRKIFTAYTQQEESIDSQENKASFTKAVQSIHTITNPDDLALLVNVWMYYDPTDFPTRALLEPVFIANKQAALKAVNKRIHNRKKWEQVNHAPYTDLFSLKAMLSK